MGVMLGLLFDDEEHKQIWAESIGKVIKSVTLGQDDALRFVFTDESKIKIRDCGQSCCENRYMRTDDKLEEFAGAALLGAEIKEGPPIADNGYAHEVQFLEIKTSKGSFTMASHNEHNGYYGGFLLQAARENT